MKKYLLLLLSCLITATSFAYDRQDTLRGSNGRGRDWWDVQKYDLRIDIDTATKMIKGSIEITFKVIKQPIDSMQIDLQDGMNLLPGRRLFDGPNIPEFQEFREGNVFWIVKPSQAYKLGKTYSINLAFQGKPRVAINPPWDGGFIWTKDSLGNPWFAVACQGLGASAWWPCKDYQGDEPDSGLKLWVDYPNPYNVISNGKFIDGDTITEEDPVTGKTFKIFANDVFSWQVKNPINAYDVTFYIGDYAHWHDTIMGEKGKLDLDFYALKYNEARARKQFAVVKQMLHCFEYWMGPYPFYEDGYKLVEAPYLGMEHQSAVAYGNKYKMGYLGRDRSGTGVGLRFDYIIIHESGHEWFGNSITAQDLADDWIQEGITTYSESLFAECLTGRDSAFMYTMGEWRNIDNDVPIIGPYGVAKEGSGDRYDKGAAIMFMVRMMLNDDSRFRKMMRGLSGHFYHKIVTTAEVENYMAAAVGKDLKPFFDTYLRTTDKPVLKWFITGKELHYQWTNARPGFFAPFAIRVNGTVVRINDANGVLPVPGKKGEVVKLGYYDTKNEPF